MLTIAPATEAATMTPRWRAGVVTPLTVTRYTPKARPKRPTMCSAFIRWSAAAIAATSIAAANVTQGHVSGVRQTGTTRDHAHEAAQAANTASNAASTVLSDWPGRRSNG